MIRLSLNGVWSTVTNVAGEVIEVGPGVQTFRAGDKVVSMLNLMVCD